MMKVNWKGYILALAVMVAVYCFSFALLDSGTLRIIHIRLGWPVSPENFFVLVGMIMSAVGMASFFIIIYLTRRKG